MAWAEDTVGRRQYVVKVMELATRKVFPIALPNVENNVVWAGDNQTFFYIEKDPETLLGFRVRSHRHRQRRTTPTWPPIRWSGSRKTRASTRSCIAPRTRSTCFIHTQSTVSTEVLVRGCQRSQKLEFKVFLPRERDHEYQVEHANGRWIVRTNYQAKNFRIVEVQTRRRRRPRANGRTSSRIATTPSSTRSTCAKNFLTIEEHSGGLRKLRIRPWRRGGKDVFVTADEPSYTMALDVNREFDSDKLRYTYTSHGHAADHLRLRLQDRQARDAQARAGARRLRPG